MPRKEDDLIIAADNGHVLVFDNISHLPSEMADALCRLATGGGYGARELYTNREEALFEVARPVILNGIEDIIKRPDLADRTIALTLQPIPDDKREIERELLKRFEAERPAFLGALLDGVVYGLRKLPNMHLRQLPRMADFARWVTACEGAFWESGTFAAAYAQNSAQTAETALEADLVASAVRSLLTHKSSWEGTATDLLRELDKQVDDKVQKSRSWPKVPNVLFGRLRRAAPILRKVGIRVILGERTGHARIRTIRLEREDPTPTPAGQDWVRQTSSTSSASPAQPGFSDTADDRTDEMDPQSAPNNVAMDEHHRRVDQQLAAAAVCGTGRLDDEWRKLDFSEQAVLKSRFLQVHRPVALEADNRLSQARTAFRTQDVGAAPWGCEL